MRRWCRLMLLLTFFLLAAFAGAGKAAAADELLSAKKCTRSLYASSKKMKYRHHWLRCIRKFEAYLRRQPRGPQAAEALYATGKLYLGLYRYSGKSADLDAAVERFNSVVKRFPKSRFADDAQYRLGEIALKYRRDPDRAYVEFFKVVINFPQGDMRERARKRLAELGGKHKGKRRLEPLPKAEHERSRRRQRAEVVAIRHWSAADYTRVVIDVSSQVDFEAHLLRADPKLRTPPRLYIDLRNARIGAGLGAPIPIGDGLLRKVRIGQYRPTVARVVLDIESIQDHKIFSLSDPFRVVVDVTGEGRAVAPDSKLTLAQQLGLTVRKVVIDPGHGGKDPGAIGPGGVREKDVVLGIAKRLQRRLRQQLKVEAVLTRSADVFLPLEERTAFANTNKADLFVSIHTNAHKNPRVKGISTYILNVASDPEAARLAAFENAVSSKRISDLERILSDLMLNAKINESTRLAQVVQEGLIKKLQRKYDHIKDLGVKQAPFYVLIGARMPCVMVEVSFISNRVEAKRLTTPEYQETVAAGIVEGIKRYMEMIETVPGIG